jgi:hypothetical protein
MAPTLTQIPKQALDTPVRGVNLAPGTLRDQLGEEETLLVFLRHFGCIFCRETVADLRAVAEADPDYPPVLFFFQGTPIGGRAFLRRYWPAVRAVADAELRFYRAFGVERGGLVEMFRPEVWRAQRRARAKGHENGERSGDIWRMPGAFLVRGERVLWAHAFRHAADHPDFAAIPALAGLRALRTGTRRSENA